MANENKTEKTEESGTGPVSAKPANSGTTPLTDAQLKALSEQEPGVSEARQSEEGMPQPPGLFGYEVLDLGSVGYLGKYYPPGSVIVMAAEDALKRNVHDKYLRPQLTADGKFKQYNLG
jgi:hypothetical protein